MEVYSVKRLWGLQSVNALGSEEDGGSGTVRKVPLTLFTVTSCQFKSSTGPQPCRKKEPVKRTPRGLSLSTLSLSPSSPFFPLHRSCLS